ncbi:MAG: DUF2490 domain-containing protein [Fluviicola sp.]
MPVILNIKAALIGIIGVFVGSISYGQNSYQFGIMPSINLNKKFETGWGLNFSTESRHLLMEGTFSSSTATDYRYDLTDFAILGSRKVGLGKRVTAGYLLRTSEESPVHRFIQQLIITQELRSMRVSHRIAADQTLSFLEPPEFRLRYRFASEIPLNGQSADPKELYLKVNNEYLGSVQSPNYYLETRLVPMLGYAATEKHKIELGIDYRFRTFLNIIATRQNFWARINWYISL